MVTITRSTVLLVPRFVIVAKVPEGREVHECCASGFRHKNRCRSLRDRSRDNFSRTRRAFAATQELSPPQPSSPFKPSDLDLCPTPIAG
jgi:hypothetical protein